jgi:hypothetical protein
MTTEDKKSTIKTADTILIEYAKKECRLFCDNQNEPYAKVQVDNHTEIWGVHSQGFGDLLRSWYYKKTKRGVNQNQLDSAIMTISAIANYDGHREDVYLRVAQEGEKIYIDMCDKNWRVIKVTNGGWTVIDNPPVAFTRTNNMKSLPYPIGGNGVKYLLKHINIKEEDLPLLTGWLLMALQSGPGAYPPLLINGPAGSGKSTACRMIRSLIDPNKADLLTQPSISDLRIVGMNNHILAFDNVSKVSPAFSDAICKISTGDNQSIRRLYTTNGEMTVSIKKPTILNGIPELAKRSDLASRSLKLTLQKVKHRKTEKQAWIDFQDDAPSILKGLLSGLTAALANLENTKIEGMTRMADFCMWATAARSAYEWEETTFIDAYTKNVKESHVDSLESSPFASAIIKMCEEGKNFHGRPLDLLEDIEVNYSSLKVTRSITWVKTAKGVIEQLDRNEESLESVGIYYEKYKDRTNKTFVKVGDLEFVNSSNEPVRPCYDF